MTTDLNDDDLVFVSARDLRVLIEAAEPLLATTRPASDAIDRLGDRLLVFRQARALGRPMRHTHHGYGHDEQSKTVTHDHVYEGAVGEHNHPEDFIAIYHDEVEAVIDRRAEYELDVVTVEQAVRQINNETPGPLRNHRAVELAGQMEQLVADLRNFPDAEDLRSRLAAASRSLAAVTFGVRLEDEQATAP
jgi:hypothetical protein